MLKIISEFTSNVDFVHLLYDVMIGIICNFACDLLIIIGKLLMTLIKYIAMEIVDVLTVITFPLWYSEKLFWKYYNEDNESSAKKENPVTT